MILSKINSLYLPHNISGVTSVSFHPHVPTVCVACGNEVLEFDLTTCSLCQRFSLEGTVSHIVHCRKNPWLLCFLNTGRIVIYDILSNQYQGAYFPVNKNQRARFSVVAVNPIRPIVYYVRFHGTRVYELNYEKNLSNRKVSSISHRKRVTALTVHPRGHGLFTGQFDGLVRYVSAKRSVLLEFLERSGRQLTKEESKKKVPQSKAEVPISVIRFGPFPQKNSTIIITGTRIGMVRIWQIYTVATTQQSKQKAGVRGGKRVGAPAGKGSSLKRRQKPRFRVVCLSSCSIGKNKWIQNVLFPKRFPFPCCLTEKGELFFLKTNHIISSSFSNPYDSKRTANTKKKAVDSLPRSFIRPFYFIRPDLAEQYDPTIKKRRKKDFIQMDVNPITGDFIFFGSKSIPTPTAPKNKRRTNEVSLFQFTDIQENSPLSISYPLCSTHHHYFESDFINTDGVLRSDHPKIYFFDRIYAFPNIMAIEQSLNSVGRRNLIQQKRIRSTLFNQKDNSPQFHFQNVWNTLILPDAKRETLFYRLVRTIFSSKKDIALLFFQSELGSGKGTWIQYNTASRTTVGGMKPDGIDGVFFESGEDSKIPFLVLDSRGKKLTRFPKGETLVFEKRCSIKRVFYIHSTTKEEGEEEGEKEKKVKNEENNVNSSFGDEDDGFFDDMDSPLPKSRKKKMETKDLPLLYYDTDRNCLVRSCVGKSIEPNYSSKKTYFILEEKERLVQAYCQEDNIAVLTNQRLFVVSTTKMMSEKIKFQFDEKKVNSCLWITSSLLFFNTNTTLYQFSIFSENENQQENGEAICTLDYNHCVLVTALFDRIIFAYYSSTNRVTLGHRYLNLFDLLIRKNPERFHEITTSSKTSLPICHQSLRHLITKTTMSSLLEKNGDVDLVGKLFSQSRYTRISDWEFHFKVQLYQLEFEKCYELLVQKFQLNNNILKTQENKGKHQFSGGSVAMLKKREKILNEKKIVVEKFKELGNVCLEYKNFEFAFLSYRKINDLESLFTLYASTKNDKGVNHLLHSLNGMIGRKGEEFEMSSLLILKKMCELYNSKFNFEKKREEVEGEEDEDEDQDVIKREFPKTEKMKVVHKEWNENIFNTTKKKMALGFTDYYMKKKKMKTKNEEDARIEYLCLQLEWLKPERLKDWIGSSFPDLTSPISKLMAEEEPLEEDVQEEEVSDLSSHPTSPAKSQKSTVSIGGAGATSSIGGGPGGIVVRGKKKILDKPEDHLPDFGVTTGTGTDATEEDLSSGESEEEGEDEEEGMTESDSVSVTGSEASSVISQAQSEPVGRLNVPKATSVPPKKQSSQHNLKVPGGNQAQKRSVTPDILQSPSKKGAPRGSTSRSIEVEGESEMKKYDDWSSSDEEPDDRDQRMSRLRKIRIKAPAKKIDEEDNDKKLSEFSFGGGFGTSSIAAAAPAGGGGRRRGRRRRLQQLQEEMKKEGGGEDGSKTGQSLVSQRLRKKLGVKQASKKKKKKKKGPVDQTVRMIERQVKGMGKIQMWKMIQRMLNDPKKFRHAFVVCSYLIREVLSVDQTEIRQRKMLIPAVKCLLYLQMVMHVSKLRESNENDSKIAFISYHLSNISSLGENVVSRSREISIDLNIKAENFEVARSQLHEVTAFDDEEIQKVQEKLKLCEGKGNKDERLNENERERFLFCWRSFVAIDVQEKEFLQCNYCRANFNILEKDGKGEEEKNLEKCEYCKYGTLEKKNSKN